MLVHFCGSADKKPDHPHAIWSLVFVWREWESLNLSTLLCLGFYEVSDITESAWVDLFEATTQLEDVAVSRKPTGGLLHALLSAGSFIGSTGNKYAGLLQ